MQVLTIDYNSPNAAAEFAKSIKETGFAVLTNHPIEPEIIFKAYHEWQEFFKSSTKSLYTFNKNTQDGYFPYLSENAKDQTEKDLKEFFHFYPWGMQPEGLSNLTLSLYQNLTKVAATLLQWLEEQTPSDISAQFSMPLTKMIEDSQRTLLRILHYPPLSGEQNNAIRAAAHEDINLITLLPAATAPGLEVKDNYGNWHAVRNDPGTIVVNAADMLQMCSQGYYCSTTHRVINPRGEDATKSRLSMPLFLHPRDEVRLSRTKTANDYRLERLGEIGLL